MYLESITSLISIGWPWKTALGFSKALIFGSLQYLQVVLELYRIRACGENTLMRTPYLQLSLVRTDFRIQYAFQE